MLNLHLINKLILNSCNSCYQFVISLHTLKTNCVPFVKVQHYQVPLYFFFSNWKVNGVHSFIATFLLHCINYTLKLADRFWWWRYSCIQFICSFLLCCMNFMVHCIYLFISYPRFCVLMVLLWRIQYLSFYAPENPKQGLLLYVNYIHEYSLFVTLCKLLNNG